MKTIKLTTTRGNVATMTVDVDRFSSKELFLTEYVGRYNKAFSGISKERIVQALTDLWYLTHPKDAPTPESEEVETSVESDPPVEGHTSKKRSKETKEATE